MQQTRKITTAAEECDGTLKSRCLHLNYLVSHNFTDIIPQNCFYSSSPFSLLSLLAIEFDLEHHKAPYLFIENRLFCSMSNLHRVWIEQHTEWEKKKKEGEIILLKTVWRTQQNRDDDCRLFQTFKNTRRMVFLSLGVFFFLCFFLITIRSQKEWSGRKFFTPC